MPGQGLTVVALMLCLFWQTAPHAATVDTTDSSSDNSEYRYDDQVGFERFVSQFFNAHYRTLDKLGTVELGLRFLPTTHGVFTNYRVATTGWQLGINLPIKARYFLLYAKARASFHGARHRTDPWVFKTYIDATNEVMVGKPITYNKEPYEAYPYIGLGFNNGVIVSNYAEEGFRGHDTHYYWHYSLGCMLRRVLYNDNFRYAMGIVISFESAFALREDPGRHLSLNLVLTR
jgi:hypothetical protein